MVRKLNLLIKRLIDIIGSLFGLLVLSPVFLIIVIVIKIESEGPVFFKQKRLGYKGKTFEIIKFRTMVQNAENMGDGLSIKSEQDSRITKVGHCLRKTSLDELPQLINVLKSEMSLVGPRPPVTYHPYNGYSNYPEESKIRFDMKPGITGLAQVEVRNAVSWDDRIKYDVQYVRIFNILLDIKVLWKTVYGLFQTENIYMEYDE